MINKWVNDNNNRWLEKAESMRPMGIEPVFSNKYHTLMQIQEAAFYLMNIQQIWCSDHNSYYKIHG